MTKASGKRTASQRDSDPSSESRTRKKTRTKIYKEEEVKKENFEDSIVEEVNEKSILNESLREEEPEYDHNVGLRHPEGDAQSFAELVVQEIALEGLNGITLGTLWTRLSVALNHLKPITRQLQLFAWDTIRNEDRLECYELQSPRATLSLQDLKNNVDIYPFVAVKDESKGIIGSCSSYSTRSLVTKMSTLEEAEGCGNTLVIVASQYLRVKSLTHEFCDPLLKFQEDSYYILEMIGRGRYPGVQTAGKNSLASVVPDPKTLFYRRIYLQDNNLILKQRCRSSYDNEKFFNATVLHLCKFFNIQKSFRQIFMTSLFNVLKQMPNHRIEFSDIRKYVTGDNYKFGIAKITKSQTFKNIFNSELKVPYREMYPLASEDEWKKVKTTEEKMIRIVKLRNPNMNIDWFFRNDDEPNEKHDSSDDEKEFCDDYPVDLSCRRRIFQAIHDSADEGITLKAICKVSGTDFYTVRAVCKNLCKVGTFYTTIEGSGKAHAAKYKLKKGKQVDKKEGNQLESAEGTDDETYDFIANVLDVDADCLKNPMDIDDDEVQDKEECEPMKEFISISPPSIPKRISNFFKDKLEVLREDKHLAIYNEAAKCELNVTLVKEFKKMLKNNWNREMMVLEPSKTLFLKMINPNYKSRHFETYVKAMYQFQESQFQVSDSDSEGEVLEDMASNFTLISGACVLFKDAVDADTKLKICQHFENDALLSDVFGCTANDAKKEEEPSELDDSCQSDQFFGQPLEFYLGPKPQIISSSTDKHGIDSVVVLSSQVKYFKKYPFKLTETCIAKKRLKIMLDFIRKQNQFVEMFRICRHVIDEEITLGRKEILARKTFLNLICELVRKGDVQVMKIILRHRNVVKSKTYALLPDKDFLPFLQSTLDQFIMSFTILAKRKIFEKENPSRHTSFRQMRNKRFRYNQHIGRVYGFYPKASRLKVLHEYLFYLIYGYNGSPIDGSEARVVFEHHCQEVNDEFVQECSTLYQRDNNWKMFIPPLPEHVEYPQGWALMADILVRLPLILFVKIFNVTYIIPGLLDYLNHPIKRNFLLMNLPSDIKEVLMTHRKYILSIFETHVYLAYMGLLQFGTQNYIDKDQVFFYLNRFAVLYDTTSSDPGYHKITDKEYPKKVYELKTFEEFEKFWAELYIISTKSNLGSRSSVVGKYIELERINNKKSMVECLESQTVESAKKRDVGYIPGDGLGVCKFDSSLWLHLIRNWSWITTKNKPTIKCSSRQNKKPIKSSSKTNVKSLKSSDVKPTVAVRNKHAKSNSNTTKSKIQRKGKVVIRKVNPRKPMPKTNVKNLKLERPKRRKRSTFTKEEDRLLLICNAVFTYLVKYSKKKTICYMTISDLVHSVLPTSRKTSVCYRKRIGQLRNSGVLDDKSDFADLKLESDFFVQKHFKGVQQKLKDTVSWNEPYINKVFLYFAYYVYQMRKDIGEATDEEAVQDYLTPSNVPKFENLKAVETVYKDAKSKDDIDFDTIVSIIHSSLGIRNVSEDWPKLLMRVYQLYPEQLLRAALNHMLEHHLLAAKKIKKTEKEHLHVKGRTYNISTAYMYKMMTAFPLCVFRQANEVLMSLCDHLDLETLSFENLDQGHCFGLNDISCITPVSYTFDLPEDLITLNKKIKDLNPLVKELAKRYEILLRKGQEDEEFIDFDLDNLESTIETFLKSKSLHKSTDLGVELTSLYDDDKAESKKKIRIADLAFMLTKGLFPELDDDDKLDKLNKYFVVEYPTCKLNVDSSHQEVCRTVCVNAKTIALELDELIIRKHILSNECPNLDATHLAADQLVQTDEILQFIVNKGFLGASSVDLKDSFSTCSDLHVILRELIDAGIILRVGICSFRFVHFNFRHNWTIFLIDDSNNDSSIGRRLRITPWFKVDGTLDDIIFQAWMHTILSHCFSHPFIPFTKLCARFSHWKPMDIFEILELLEKLTCIHLWTYEKDNNDDDGFFSEASFVSEAPTVLTDDLRSVFVETDLLALTKFGTWLNRKRTEYADVFNE